MKICNKCQKNKNIDDFRINRNQCKQCEKEYAKKYRKENHDIVLERTKKWRENNKDKIKEYEKSHKRYRKPTEKRKLYLKNYMSKWRKENKEYINKYKLKTYYNHKEDNLYIFKINVRSLIQKSFREKGIIKSKRTEDIIKISLKELYVYLLKTYEENYGYKWDCKEKVHIDHIIPLSTAKTEEEVIKLNHYTNLQLLKAEDNLHKSNKLNWKLGDNNVK